MHSHPFRWNVGARSSRSGPSMASGRILSSTLLWISIRRGMPGRRRRKPRSILYCGLVLLYGARELIAWRISVSGLLAARRACDAHPSINLLMGLVSVCGRAAILRSILGRSVDGQARARARVRGLATAVVAPQRPVSNKRDCFRD